MTCTMWACIQHTRGKYLVQKPHWYMYLVALGDTNLETWYASNRS